MGKELTKMFEKIYRGKISEVLTAIQKDGVKGEYCVIVSCEDSKSNLTKNKK